MTRRLLACKHYSAMRSKLMLIASLELGSDNEKLGWWLNKAHIAWYLLRSIGTVLVAKV